MGQVNVNRPADTSDGTAAAGTNLVAMLIGLVVVIALAAVVFLAFGRGGSGTSPPVQQPAPNTNVNPPQQPAPNINVNPPQPPAPNININPPGGEAQPPANPPAGP